MTARENDGHGQDTSLSFLLQAKESVKRCNDQLTTMACKKDQDFLELHLGLASDLLERCIGRLKETTQGEKGQGDSSSSSSIPEIGQLKIVFSPTDEPSEEYYFYAWQPGGGPVKKLMRNDFVCPVPLTRPLHGIVLLRCAYEGGYYVCNPCTGALLPLPDSNPPLKMNLRPPTKALRRPPWYLQVAYGFGYCSTTNEYKVVRLFSDDDVYDYETSAPSCEVFVLDKLAYWRPSAQQPPACVVEEGNPAVFIEGHLHFLCRDGGITTFNISDEAFGSLPSPPHPKDAPVKMTELDGCLCVYHGGIGDGDDAPYNIWLLRDYEARRWEHLCCIDTTAWPENERMELKSGWIAPLGMYDGGNGQKKIVFGTGTCKVFVVDLLNINLPEIMFRPEESIAGSFDDTEDCPAIGLFEESIVPLGRTIEEMVLSSPVTKAWFDVLKWLPARSVSELSLVSREWRTVVTSDCFRQSHAVHANSIDRLSIKFMDPRLHYFIDVNDMVNLSDLPDTMPFFMFMCEQFECSQPCHGLNLGSCDGAYFLCNPAMGYHHSILTNVVDDSTGHIALGYDSEIDVHVLVHLAYEEKNLETRSYTLRCSILCTNEYEWDQIDPPPRPVADVPAVYADGKIYWMVHPDLWPTCELVTFNTMDYEFEVLQGPPCHGKGHVSMLELNGAICVACSDRDADAIDVWMMKDDMTWCVEYRIELGKFSPEYSSEKTTVMCVDPTDGRILLNTGKALGYYDPNTLIVETIYSVSIDSKEGDNNKRFCPVICQESLLRPYMKQYFMPTPPALSTDSGLGAGSGLQVENSELIPSLPSEEKNAAVEMIAREAREG